jgi:hypothetical protein
LEVIVVVLIIDVLLGLIANLAHGGACLLVESAGMRLTGQQAAVNPIIYSV